MLYAYCTICCTGESYGNQLWIIFVQLYCLFISSTSCFVNSLVSSVGCLVGCFISVGCSTSVTFWLGSTGFVTAVDSAFLNPFSFQTVLLMYSTQLFLHQLDYEYQVILLNIVRSSSRNRFVVSQCLNWLS